MTLSKIITQENKGSAQSFYVFLVCNVYSEDAVHNTGHFIKMFLTLCHIPSEIHCYVDLKAGP